MDRRLAAADLHDVRLLLVAHHAIEHELDLLHRAMRLPMRARLRVADGAGQVARVGDFHQRKATVLLMVRAESAIVGTAVLDRRVELQRQLARLQRQARALVVIDVGGDEHLFETVARAPLVQVDALVLENDFRLHLAQARGADAVGQFVVKIRAVSHGCSRSGVARKASSANKRNRPAQGRSPTGCRSSPRRASSAA